MNPETLITPAVSHLASNGLLGALVIVLLWAYREKDRQLHDQSEKNLTLIIKIHEKVMDAVTKMADLMEFIEKRERERELAAARASAAGQAGPYRNPVPNWPKPPGGGDGGGP